MTFFRYKFPLSLHKFQRCQTFPFLTFIKIIFTHEKEMVQALILILITISTSAEDLTSILKSDKSENSNLTELEKTCYSHKQKYESIFTLSEISAQVKNTFWNESIKKHKYFVDILNQDELELISKEN